MSRGNFPNATESSSTSGDHFIGWDAGGWNCDKKPWSRDAIVILDSELAIVGEPRRGNLRKAINDSANTAELVRNLFRLCDAEVVSESSYVTMAIDMPQGLSEHFIELTEG